MVPSMQGPRVCQKDGCDVVFNPTGHASWLRTYCDDHKIHPSIAETRRDAASDARWCQLEECGQRVPETLSANAKYCTKAHKEKAGWRRQNAKQAAKNKAKSIFKAPQGNGDYSTSRTGEIYDKLRDDPLLTEMLISGKVTASSVAAQLGVSVAGVTRAMHGVLADQAFQDRKSDWEQSSRVKAMLPTAKMERLKEMGMTGQLDDEFHLLVDELVRAYSVFSRRYFRLEGKRPIIKDFHLRWIRSIILAYATGGKQLILSPPRHGKSEVLIRFVVWFIVMDPNIRIGWFCASRDVAELMLGSVKDIFESDTALIKDTLPPGELYDPGLKSGKPWSKKELKVAQQSHVGAKSSSLIALGRTSKFLSRDMDVIIVDDLEDYDSTREENQRLYSRNKLAEIGTRKVEQTCEVYIGSRQHPDDIPNLLLGLEETILAWQTIVDTAHDPECGEDPDDFDAHYDCMLFPEVRSYRYLMEKKMEMEVLGLAHLYPMRYLNSPIPEEGQVFDISLIKEQALDRERGLGTEGLPLGILAAGLDPSARGIQAGFCWHYRDGKLSMVDLDAKQSGGMAGAHKLMRDWHEMYGLTHWFYEDNAQQVEFFNDPRTRELALELGLTIKPFTTGRNKQDPELGISSMAPMFHNGSISLPYGTKSARVKVNMYLRQLELWTTDGIANKKKKTDIKMASWFPFPYFVKKMKKDREIKLQASTELSYPGYTGSQAPWQQTNYPGRM